MSEKRRKAHGVDFKATLGIEALRKRKTANELGQARGFHPLRIRQWKKELVEGAPGMFETKRGCKGKGSGMNEEALHGEIGQPRGHRPDAYLRIGKTKIPKKPLPVPRTTPYQPWREAPTCSQ